MSLILVVFIYTEKILNIVKVFVPYYRKNPFRDQAVNIAGDPSFAVFLVW